MMSKIRIKPATTMTNYEIITKLIGPIQALGSHGEDEYRLQNLEEAIIVVEQLVSDIAHAANDQVRQEASMKAIGQRAQEFLDELRDSQ